MRRIDEIHLRWPFYGARNLCEALRVEGAYLVAIIDWYSRRVLSCRLSNTMKSSFCVEALQEALERFPKPDTFNTDQGSQLLLATSMNDCARVVIETYQTTICFAVRR